MLEIISKKSQAYGEFNNGEIIENKPVGFPNDGGKLKAYSNLFYWAYAKANFDSMIDLHPHKGFEIITYVVDGEIKHYDTLIKKWISLKKGDIQIIQAGSGISHSEFLKKNSSIFQIWLDPNIYVSINNKPKYKDYKASTFKIYDNKKTIIGEKSQLKVQSEGVEIFELIINNNEILQLDSLKYYSIYVIEGLIKINKIELKCDDFIKIYNENNILITMKEKSRLFVVVSPVQLSYNSYASQL
tara:strand:- start:114106 stop:114834 length:729 start_codon:yes stop_codon:yes gene_type:complete